MALIERSTWYERQLRRRSSPFYRLLDRSFGFRVLVAGLTSFTLLALVNRFENCHGAEADQHCLTSSFAEIVSVGNVESFSIVAAGLVYILEAGRRKEREHQEAFELILRARESGARVSLGRIRAVEDLSAAGLFQDDFDLSGINLVGLKLSRSRWRGADFTGSDLKAADFREADLQRAIFRQADLSGADCRDADLRGAQLAHAILRNVDLRGANLEGASFTGADLTAARLDPGLAISTTPQPRL
ncbi:pentapeptide repeat-containing protein [Synechococcus sp. CS-1325]|uniref:pentapeptide repeat-containing protein n=1 Tax=unclassified Synechococcus TaxID=2626047 RepID=UPI000DB20A48|nr:MULTISPECIES: pentapeptide repeat-containing protein [unclassified Synechococcus]MCT0199645.1 pentapeptide repeat-containing protein [Synechococcus sp. CS-1325]MCT0230147.1 pentapeptide repeat-containing protein [Synechococcus sp. CS-1324]PZU96049.1 MAG: pentapeptide repeat-containing protein [Cyanobium sp.]PZV00419.1 MAG: pentapeptide repeat-containing protein [Cyanobium sp.]